MYSYEDRLRAVELYIKLGKRVRATIRQLGYRRMRASLNKQRISISEKVVQRLMKQECLIVATPKRRRYGSYLGEISPAPDNLLNRDFRAAVPNEKWLTDITEFQIAAGILQPIVVHPADAQGQHRIHFGAKRWRAAQLANLLEVPIVVRHAPADPYAQVAENQKRHGLTPLDLARFIRGRVDAGDSNATVAKRLGMNLTTVAHHLAMLELPPELDEALKSGRITSPRTLHELSNLHAEQPEQVRALMTSGAEITRSTVSALRDAPQTNDRSDTAQMPSNKLVAQANVACDRLERALGRIRPSNSHQVALPELIALRIRVEDITKRWLQGSDSQTPSQSSC